MVFKKIIFQNRCVALETLPPFMANTILNFHFDNLHTSLPENLLRVYISVMSTLYFNNMTTSVTREPSLVKMYFQVMSVYMEPEGGSRRALDSLFFVAYVWGCAIFAVVFYGVDSVNREGEIDLDNRENFQWLHVSFSNIFGLNLFFVFRVQVGG